MVVSGVARFDSVPGSTANGALNYAGTIQKPIRGATVEILNAANDAVLASTASDGSGAYTASIATAGGLTQVKIRVRAQSVRTAAGAPTWNFAIRDNTAANAMYVIDTAPIALSAATLTRDVLAQSGWGGAGYTAARAAAPFAILDAVYEALNRTATAAPTQVWPSLSLFWSVNNVPVDGNIAAGQIGTTFYGGPDNTGVHRIFVLGAANTDTDEYDSHVITHEWGHFFQAAVSRDDSIGGPHSGNDRLDMRVAFSEGWGNAWSGIALNDPVYRDSGGANQQAGFAFNVSTMPTVQPGWYKEDSNQYLIWTLNQTYGFTPIWQAMTGGVRTNLAATSIYSFASTLKTVLPANAVAINTLLASQNIVVNDAFGTGETNSGGISVVDLFPIYKTFVAPATTQQLCVTSAAGVFNKLGNINYTRFTALTARAYTFTLAGGVDPDFEIFRPGFFDGGFGVVVGSETKTVNLAAGEYIVGVTEAAFAAANMRVCMNLTIN